MLPRQHRLVRPADFTAAVRSGGRAGDRLMVLHLQASASSGTPLVGFVVSKAVGGAVVRTSVKRRLRHLVRDRLDRLPQGTRLVVRAQPAAAAADHGELLAAFDRCLARVLSRQGAGTGPEVGAR